MTNEAAAGWYSQADGSQRYWDGHDWTEHTTAAVQSEPVTGAAAEPRPWWKKKRFIIPGAVAAAFIVLIFVGAVVSIGAGDDGDNVAAGTSPSPAITESSPTPSAEQTEENVVPATFTMPDLLGQNLQEAQNALQGMGSREMDQQDASGQERLQVLDSNWQVCTQEPTSGREVPVDTEVVLASVKLDEVCPGDEAKQPAKAEETVKAEAPAKPAETKAPAKPKETKEPAKPKETRADSMTASQTQAVKLAEQYLGYSSFSRSGLIEQLEYEGFSNSDAKFGADYIDVDWRKQGAAKAEEYLDYSAFSKSGLIEQLEYEGFSNSDAKYGTEKLKADWNEQAAAKAQEYLDYSAFSRSGLIDQLEFEGFTHQQAEYGADAVGL